MTSSLIRKQLAAGAVAEAGRLLEKPYFIDGMVERGAGRGRQLGFPTMNIASGQRHPALRRLPYRAGHLAGRLHVRASPSTNIGRAPTFPPDAASCRVETHVPGFQGMVYGQKVRLHFIDKIRDERKFASASALVEQIRRDIAFLGI